MWFLLKVLVKYSRAELGSKAQYGSVKLIL
jgi:hypothetical protein